MTILKNGIPFRQNLVSTAKHGTKCPYTMVGKKVTLHETDNEASANNEIAYMIRNDNQVSFHVAIDEKEVVQGIPFNRNTWHAGDGGNGYGNRNTIAVEICKNYDRSRGTINLIEPLKSQHIKAEQNAIKYIAQLCVDEGIVANNNNIKTHKDWNGKLCPRKILSEKRLQIVKSEIIKEYNRLTKSGNTVEKPADTSKQLYRVQVGAYSALQNAINMVNKIKSLGFEAYMVKVGNLYKVQTGAYGVKANADAQLKKLKAKGLDAFITTEQGSPANITPTKKSINEIAKEVIKGNWGNGEERKKKLIAAGYNYNKVQKEVSKLLK